MQASEVLDGNSTGVLPPLSDGEASEAAGRGLVVPSDLAGHNLWLDLGIALVIAVAAPLLLKKLLETEFAARLFRAPVQNSKTAPASSADEDFDFDT